jgi:putative ABC transport system ATP-binding protein
MAEATTATATADDIVVRCRGLHKSYGAGEAVVPALRGVDLDVRRGELLMLVGPSGCGKTTLLSIITSILDADSGRCDVLGQEPARMDESARARFRGRSIGFVFQAFNLLPALTALENVSVPLLLQGLPRRDAQARARGALASVGLEARRESRPAQLSGGQQQRVAIARALVHAPQLVVCDEPTSNLDHQSGQDMMALLRDLARAPERALVVVTHDPRIFEYADRTAHMDDGRIVDIRPAGSAGASP